MAETIDWTPPRPPRRRRGLPIILGAVAVFVFGGGTILSYYVDALWFESLGVADVFWTTLRLQRQTFTFFAVATFLILYRSFLAFEPAARGAAGRGGPPDLQQWSPAQPARRAGAPSRGPRRLSGHRRGDRRGDDG